MEMTPLDYGRSFLIGKGAENEVRFCVESRTRVVDGDNGNSEDFFQTASCKSEHTFAESGLFQEDNYNFLPIFGPHFGIIYRRKAYLNQNYREVVPTDRMFGGHELHLVEVPDARDLNHNNEAIRKATHAFAPIVSQTEIRDKETGRRAIVECPVKTMNTRWSDNLYQVDTGPVAFPDLSQKGRIVDSISLAFIAFNAPHFVDVVVETQTSITADTSVYHYSRLLTLSATNRLIAIDVETD